MRMPHARRIPLFQRALFGFIGTVSGAKVPDIAYIVLHRPELFGGDFARWIHELLRGESDWSVGERELMASYTARLQDCEF